MSVLNNFKRVTAVCLISGTLVAATATAATAHVTVSPSAAPAAGYAKLDMRVPHGCESAATNTVRVQVPDGINSVTPQVVPGWDVTVNMEPLNPPVSDGHGGQLTERAAEVVWTGGPLPDKRLQEFGMSLKLPEGKAGDKLYFPAIQECDGGAQEAWIEIPADGQSSDDLDKPAPVLTLTAASEDGHGASTETTADEGNDALTITALLIGGLGFLTGLLSLGLVLRRKS